MNHDFRTFAPANRPAVISTAITSASARRKTRQLGSRGRFVFLALCAYGGRIVARFDSWMAGRRRWQQPATRWWNGFNTKNHNRIPGKASVIFWTNGPEVKLNARRNRLMRSGGDGSPTTWKPKSIPPCAGCVPGESCSFETEWFPTRAGSEFHGVTDAGIVVATASSQSSGERQSRTFRIVWRVVFRTTDCAIL